MANQVGRVPVRTRTETHGPAVGVLVVDDNDLFRSRFVEYLNALDGACVVGEARDGNEGISKTDTLRPNIVFMDLSMPHLGGFEATKRIKASFPETRVVIVTIHEEESYRYFAELCHADGIVCKSSITREIPSILNRMLSEGNTGGRDPVRDKDR